MELQIPFNSINHDRVYDAGDIAGFVASIVTDGVHPNPGDNLQVTSAGGMGLSILPGVCCIKGRIGANSQAEPLTLAEPDPALGRVDAVVARLDILGRQLILAVKEGTPASQPAAPALQRDETVWELMLARAAVAADAEAITQADITDTRHVTDLCGLMSSLVQADPTGLFAQYDAIWNNWLANITANGDGWKAEREAAFDGWFLNVQGLMDGDAAANLAGQVATLNALAPGTVYEAARHDITIPAVNWAMDASVNGYRTDIIIPEALQEDQEIIATALFAPGMDAPGLRSIGAAADGLVSLFADDAPADDVALVIAVYGKRTLASVTEL